VLTTRDGSVMTFDGETFNLEGMASSDQAQLIVKLAQRLDWPALVVEADPKSADEIIVAGACIGLTAINTCASDEAIGLIHRRYGHLVADTIRPLDPCSIIDRTLKRAVASVETAEPTVVTSKEATMPDSASTSDSDEFDMPEPRSSRGDEEKRRLEGGLLFEKYVALRHERKLQRNLGREEREERPPANIAGIDPP
jgi:hypothetical protein